MTTIVSRHKLFIGLTLLIGIWLLLNGVKILADYFTKGYSEPFIFGYISLILGLEHFALLYFLFKYTRKFINLGFWISLIIVLLCLLSLLGIFIAQVQISPRSGDASALLFFFIVVFGLGEILLPALIINSFAILLFKKEKYLLSVYRE